MVCKINNNILKEEMDFLEQIEYLDEWELKFECQYAMAFGCQCFNGMECDRGEACMDI